MKLSHTPSAEHAPWQARMAAIFFSQLGLAWAQFLAYKQQGGPEVTVLIAGLQALQGSIAAFGLSTFRGATKLVQAVRGAKVDETIPPDGPVAKGPE